MANMEERRKSLSRRFRLVLTFLAFLLSISIIYYLLSAIYSLPSSSPSPTPSFSRSSGMIHLKSREIDPSDIVEDDVLSVTNDIPSSRGTYAFVIPFSGMRSPDARKALEARGLRVIGYMPDRSYLVEATPQKALEISKARGFGRATAFRSADKIARQFARLLTASLGPVTGVIVPLSPEDVVQLCDHIEAEGGTVLLSETDAGGRIFARAKPSLFIELLGRGDVRWLEERLKPVPMNDLAVTNSGINVHSAWDRLGLTGTGQVIGIADTGLDTGIASTIHEDLRGRVVAMRVTTSSGGFTRSTSRNPAADNGGHGTHTAGSIAGNGSMSGGQYKGVAYGASLYVQKAIEGYLNEPGVYGNWSMTQLLSDGQNNSTTFHYIHSDSWGLSSTDYCGDYMDDCHGLDEYTFNNPDVLPVFSAGNNKNRIAYPSSLGSAPTVTPPTTAKNCLSVGAVHNLHEDVSDSSMASFRPLSFSKIAPFSSQGPCDDGRIKPDVMAPGYAVASTRSHTSKASYTRGLIGDDYAYESGTSMSCPLVAGAAALTRQFLIEQTDNTTPSAALLKAILCGGATDISAEPNTNISSYPAPNVFQGWGRVNLADTLSPTDGSGTAFYDWLPFYEGTTWSVSIDVTNSLPLAIQLAWVDYPAEPSAATCLVNDLDLVVVSPSGTVLCGNGGSSADRLNNMESVRIASPEPGTYTVTVVGHNVPYCCEEGGAAALYMRGAFDPDTEEVQRTYPEEVTITSTGFAIKDYSVLFESSNTVSGGSTVNVSVASSGAYGDFFATNGTLYRLALIQFGNDYVGYYFPFDNYGALMMNFDLIADSNYYIDYYYAPTNLVSRSVPAWWYYRKLYCAIKYGGLPESTFDSGDWDSDGFTNAQEYEADTDPLDPASSLSFVSAAGGGFAWKGGRESTQIVEATDRIGGTWNPVYTNSPPTSVTNSLDLSALGGTNRFFRIRAIR